MTAILKLLDLRDGENKLKKNLSRGTVSLGVDLVVVALQSQEMGSVRGW